MSNKLFNGDYDVLLFNNDSNKIVSYNFICFYNALYVLFYWYETEIKQNTLWYKRLIPICIKKNGRVIDRCSNYEDSYKYVLKEV